MREIEIAVIGGGPAGLCAATSAASAGAQVLLIDEGQRLGGQLVKQTHKFFGSKEQYAGVRGIEIGEILAEELRRDPRANVMLNATVVGYYEDGVLTVVQGEQFLKIKPKRLILATGASERMVAFVNNDLPGVYGAGAVQTLMNVYGVLPGERALMVGAGNIGLIVSYQLLQAGVEVEAVVEALPRIGGYWVHASKIRRAGVPILTRHTVLRAYGEESVQGAVICRIDERGEPIPGTERDLRVDIICLAVGLSPLAELLWQAECAMRYVPELGGHVAIRSRDMETTVPGIYVAGDVAGVEEASSAMVEGRLAGLAAALSLGYWVEAAEERIAELRGQLGMLRAGSVGEKTRRGLAQAIYGE